MAVDSLQISAKTAKPPRRRGNGRPFEKGRSGNPSGRPRGRKNNATLAIEALFEGEADALARKAVELALAGNALALKLCLDRLSAPRRERAVAFALPAIGSVEDLAGAMAAIAAAVAAGELTPGEAFDMARVADSFLRVIDARDAERQAEAVRRRDGEREAAEKPVPRRDMSFRDWLDDHFKDGRLKDGHFKDGA